jgi:hypothetical protein
VDPERDDAHDVAVIDLRDRDRARHLG